MYGAYGLCGDASLAYDRFGLSIYNTQHYYSQFDVLNASKMERNKRIKCSKQYENVAEPWQMSCSKFDFIFYTKTYDHIAPRDRYD